MERKSKVNVDPGQIVNHSYNQAAGAQKNIEVGKHLVPLKSDATTYTTDASTARALPSKGRNLAIYNNAGTVGVVTLGDSAGMAALTIGATDADGNVGIPCKPNDWTYIACNEKQFVKTSAATLFVFLIEDDTSK
jgi:hypothetical protein